MCLMHDVVEARSGDHNWIHKRYVKVFEDEIIADQSRGLSSGDELTVLRTRYRERTTHEAKIAKDADLLDQLLLLKEYEHGDNKEAAKWLAGRREAYLQNLNTALSCPTSQTAARAILDGDPSDWWGPLWTSENR